MTIIVMRILAEVTTLDTVKKIKWLNRNRCRRISKKKAVASENPKGLVTGKTVGNSMIMATSQNGYSADCLVVCQAKITGIKIESSNS